MRKRTAAVIGVGLAGVVLAFPYVGGRLALDPALDRAAARLGRPTRAASARLGLGTLTLEDFSALGLLHARIVRVEVRLGSLFSGPTQIAKVTIIDGDVDFDRKSPDEREDKPAGTGKRDLPHVVLENVKLRARDDARGVSVEVARIDADIPATGPGQATLTGAEMKLAFGPSAGAKRLDVGLPDGPRSLPSLRVEGGRGVIWKGLALSGISGTIEPKGEDELQIALKGGYLDSPGDLWSATGEVRPRARSCDVDVKAQRFTMDRLAPVLKEGLVINPQLASVDAALRVRARQGHVAFDGQLGVEGLSLFHEALADEPVSALTVHGQVRGAFDADKKKLTIDEAVVQSRGVTAVLKGALDASRRPPRYELAVKIPTVPCKVALAALPPEVVPKIKGFKLDGKFGVDLTMVIDRTDLEATGVYGSVGIDGCKVAQAPELTSAKRLGGSFEHTVIIKPGEELKFIIGPENPDFAPIAEVSPHLVNALLTTEDSGFFRHRGIVPSQIREALRKNVERGYFRLGASTITMQMVKNVLLAREKTLARKLQELFLTWYVERTLDKDRILEIYLNAIEFGPRIYGLGRATRHYFGKKPKDLTPREAAFFSSILPSPKRRYVHYCAGAPNERWEKYLARILQRMYERDRLSEADLALALATPLKFDVAERGTEKECFDRMNALVRPTDPDPEPEELPAGGAPVKRRPRSRR